MPTQTFCCTTRYSLSNVELDRPSFPSQSISTVADGKMYTYRLVMDSTTRGSTDSAMTNVVDGVPSTVYGIPLNGLNVIASTSTSGATSTSSGTFITSTGAAGELITVTTSSDTSSAQNSSSSSSGPHSVVGVAVGASVGEVFDIIMLAAVVFIIWRRRRKNLGNTVLVTTHEMDATPGALGKTPTPSVSPLDLPKLATELDSSRYYEAYELPADTHVSRDRNLARKTGLH